MTIEESTALLNRQKEIFKEIKHFHQKELKSSVVVLAWSDGFADRKSATYDMCNAE